MFQGTGFGGSTNSPFGSTAYKPTTSVFNSGPMFGSTGGSSLFGSNTTQPSTGLFGSTTTPAFGQTQPQQNSFGGTQSNGFPPTGTAGTGLFGQQQNANTGGLFGSTSTPFGQNKPAFGGFGTTGQSTGLFGQQATPAQPNQPLFGQPQAQQTTGLFGASTAFGGGATAGGTTIKFTPVTGSDTMVKNGVSSQISTRHHCITCMKEYESKSLEELRLEDYAANRKGPQQGGGQSGAPGGLFGAPTQQQQPSLFGAPNTAASTGLFGSAPDNKSVFGAPTSTGFGGGNTSLFGGGNAGGSMFNKPAASATPFGTTPASSAATTNFGFNANASNSLFGANTQTSGFNTFNTSQPSTGFGTQTSGFTAFGTNQQQGALFNQNKPTFSLGPNTSQGFSFGSTAPTSSTLTSSFTANKSAPFSNFGQPASTSSTFGQSTGFGQAAPNQSSFFSNSFNKPTSTGFSFGNTTTTNTLGTGLNFGSGGSLFGQNQSKPGGLFNSGSSSLFGTGNTFSTGTFNTGSPGLGPSTFSLGPGQPTNSLLPPFGQSAAAPQNNSLNQYMLALASMPFGDSPLFKNLAPTANKSDEGIKATSPAAMKALQSGINHKVLPNSNSKVKIIKPSSTSRNSLFDGLYDEEEELNGSLSSGLDSNGLKTPRRLNARRLNLSHRPFNDSSYADNNNSYDLGSSTAASPPPASDLDRTFTCLVKKNILLQPDQLNESDINRNTERLVASPLAKMNSSTLNSSKMLESPNASLDSSTIEDPLRRRGRDDVRLKRLDVSKMSIGSLTSQPESKEPPVAEQSTSTSSSGESEGDDCVGDQNEEPHPAGIVLTRSGYYTIPSLADLAQLMDNDGRCIVDNFTIGRLNYGNVFYPESFNVANLNLDKIVHFRHKEVVIYPDDEDKPPVGHGLNRRAQVTLDRVWPLDRQTRQPISDPLRLQSIDFESKLRQASAKHGTRFIEYRPQTGSWVFKVDHFSKYGLTDSDEEEGGNTEVKKSAKFPPVLPGKEQMQQLDPTSAPGLNRDKLKLRRARMDMDLDPLSHHLFLEDEDEEMTDEPFDLYEVDGILSPTSRLSRQLGTSAHKLQLMKASFFEPSLPLGEEMMEAGERDLYALSGVLESQPVGHLQLPLESSSLSLPYRQPGLPQRPLLTITHDDHAFLDESGEEEVLPDIQGVSSVLKLYAVEYGSSWLTAGETTVLGEKGDLGHLADQALARGLSFRPSWAPAGLFTTVQPDCPLTVGIMSLSSPKPQSYKDSIVEQLEGALKCSVISMEGGLPLALCPDGVATLAKHLSIARHQPSTDQMFLHAFALCHALWGHLPDIDSEDTGYCVSLARRQAVSSWLETVTAPLAKADMDLTGDSPSSVFSLMTCHSVLEASKLAISIGDKRLSLVMSQAGSSRVVRGLVERQLVEWRETQADRHIDPARMRLYMLAAGRLTHHTSDPTLDLHACHSLDWLRAFALHLWYVCWSTSSVPEALSEYDSAWNCEMSSAPAPLPPHVSGTAAVDTPPSSLLYHLLKLFSDRSHPMELLLNPDTHSSDPLDYRLSWLLMRVLMSLGYSHLSEYNSCLIHTSFASQLELYGLWHWAVFVLLHVDSPQRETLIRDTIERHIVQEEDSTKERFLRDKLKIPIAWIASAKATRAIVNNSYEEAARNLLLAGNWNYAHEIIMKHIASPAMISEKYSVVEELLGEVEKEERYREVLGWESGGLVLVEYLRGVRLVESVRSSGEVDSLMHDLTTMASRLYTRIRLLPSTLPVDRLCQKRLAERLARLLPEIPLESVCMSETMLTDEGNMDQWQPWTKIAISSPTS